MTAFGVEGEVYANPNELGRNGVNPVDRVSNEFKVIENYLHTTHGRHHSSYTL